MSLEIWCQRFIGRGRYIWRLALDLGQLDRRVLVGCLHSRQELKLFFNLQNLWRCEACKVVVCGFGVTVVIHWGLLV